ncbi:hypothetical protein EON65_29670, partial [archaeon]
MTMRPSESPSVSPSELPTMTMRPSESPSVSYIPSYLPSPSWLPTFLSYNYSKVGLRSAFYNFLDDKYSSSIGGCSSWLNFLFNDVYISSLDSFPSSLMLMVLSDIQLSEPITVRCDNTQAISNILSAIFAFNRQLDSYNCSGSTWKVSSCGGASPALCVNCSNPCVESGSRYLNPFRISPCTQSIGFLPSAGFMSLSFLDIYPPPLIDSIVPISNKTSIEVIITLDGPGIISCGAFDASSAITISQEQILVQNNMVLTESNVSSLVFYNLQPNTDYMIACLTQSFTGYTSISNVNIIESASIETRTACCGEVIVDLLVRSLIVNESRADIVRIYMENPPDDDLTVTLSGYFFNDSARSARLLFTKSFDLSTQYFGSRYLPFTSALVSHPGTITLMASVSGSSYNVTFRQLGAAVSTYPNRISVIDEDHLPRAPSILAAAYSSNGMEIFVTFDIETNRAGLSVIEFNCIILFNFPGGNMSSCRFMSDSQVVISLSATPVIAKDPEILFLSGKLTARCDKTFPCDTLAHNVEQSILASCDKVDAPLVSISGPSLVYYKQAVVLDLSYSRGSVGRRWRTVEIKAHSMYAVTDKLEHFLSSLNYDGSPIEIPAGFLKVGTFNFIVTLCNAFDKCALATKLIVITLFQVPYSFIVGQQLLQFKAAEGLDVTVNSVAVPLSNNSLEVQSRDRLQFTWELRRNGIMQSSKYSGVRNTFKLPGYTFVPGTVYQITSVVYDPDFFVPSVSRQIVSVVSSSLQAVITGGPTQVVVVNSAVFLNASMSYDEDLDPSLYRGFSAGLRFHWSCIGIYPRVSEICYLDMLTPVTSSALMVQAGYLSLNSTSRLRVVITKDVRQTEAIIDIVVVGMPESKTEFVLPHSITAQTKQSVDSPFEIVVQVTRPLSNSLELMVSSAGGDSHSVIIESPQVLFMDQHIYSHFLPSKSLIGGSDYLFRAREIGTVIWTTVQIKTNRGPLPGIFDVSRVDGGSVNKFRFSADLWQDEDLPLSFAFGYKPLGFWQLWLQPRSQHSIAYGRVFATNSVNVSCFLETFDYLNAKTLVEQNVELVSTPLPYIVNASNILVPQSFTELMAYLYYAPELQFISFSLLKCQQLKCSSSPSCASLNRQPCSTVQDTCGSCLQGFVGVLGDSNTVCINQQDTFALSLHGVCSVDSDCPILMRCSNLSTCIPQSKTCTLDCSGRGECIYKDMSTKLTIDDCNIAESYCSAFCQCESGYRGMTCQYTELEWHFMVGETEATLAAINYVLVDSMLDTATVLQVLNNMYQLLKVQGELTTVGVSMVLSSTTSALKSLIGKGVSYDDIMPAFYFLDKLQQSDVFVPSFQFESLLKAIDDVVMDSQFVRNSSLVYLGVGYRSVYYKVRVAQAWTQSVPLTPLEYAFGRNLATVSLETYNSSNPASQLPVTVQIYSQRISSTVDYILESLPIRVSYDSLIGCEGIGCIIELEIYHNKPLSYLRTPQEFTYECTGQEEQTTFLCDNGDEITFTCEYLYVGSLLGQCSFDQLVPVCSKIESSVISPDACETLLYDPQKTVCKCDLANPTNRRRLQASSSAVSLDVVLTLQNVVRERYVGPPWTPTAQPTYSPQYPRITLSANSTVSVEGLSQSLTTVDVDLLGDVLSTVLGRNMSDVTVMSKLVSPADPGDTALMGTIIFEVVVVTSAFCSASEVFSLYETTLQSALGMDGLINRLLSDCIANSSSTTLVNAYVSTLSSTLLTSSSVPVSTAFCIERSRTLGPTQSPTSSPQDSNTNSIGDTNTAGGNPRQFIKNPGTLVTYIVVLVLVLLISVLYAVSSNRFKTMFASWKEYMKIDDIKEKEDPGKTKSFYLKNMLGSRSTSSSDLNSLVKFQDIKQQKPLSTTPTASFSSLRSNSEESPLDASVFGMPRTLSADMKRVSSQRSAFFAQHGMAKLQDSFHVPAAQPNQISSSLSASWSTSLSTSSTPLSVLPPVPLPVSAHTAPAPWPFSMYYPSTIPRPPPIYAPIHPYMQPPVIKPYNFGMCPPVPPPLPPTPTPWYANHYWFAPPSPPSGRSNGRNSVARHESGMSSLRQPSREHRVMRIVNRVPFSTLTTSRRPFSPK